MKIPARWLPFEAREGMLVLGVLPIRQVRRAVTRSLATMDQAVRVFAAVAELLGNSAWLDPAGGENARELYVRDPVRRDLLVPEPLLRHIWCAGGSGSGPVMHIEHAERLVPADMPDGWKSGDPSWDPAPPMPEVVPRGPNMRGGRFRIGDGPASFEVEYDDRGRLDCTSESAADSYTLFRYDGIRPYSIDPLARPPTPAPVSLLLRGDLDPRGHRVDEIARMIGEVRPAARVPGRVRVPVPVPHGARAAFDRAVTGMRRALLRGAVPPDARWLAADGLDGTAVASGRTLDDALAGWQGALERARPAPPGTGNVVPLARTPKTREPPEPGVLRDERGRARGISTGVIVVEGSKGAELEWPEASAVTAPLGLITLPDLPATAPDRWRSAGFTRWARVVGALGDVGHLLVREDARGFTAVGEGALDLADPETLDGEVDRSLAAERELIGNDFDLEPYPVSVRHFSAVDVTGRARGPLRSAGGCNVPTYDPGNIDGDVARWTVTRMWVKGA